MFNCNFQNPWMCFGGSNFGPSCMPSFQNQFCNDWNWMNCCTPSSYMNGCTPFGYNFGAGYNFPMSNFNYNCMPFGNSSFQSQFGCYTPWNNSYSSSFCTPYGCTPWDSMYSQFSNFCSPWNCYSPMNSFCTPWNQGFSGMGSFQNNIWNSIPFQSYGYSFPQSFNNMFCSPWSSFGGYPYGYTPWSQYVPQNVQGVQGQNIPHDQNVTPGTPGINNTYVPFAGFPVNGWAPFCGIPFGQGWNTGVAGGFPTQGQVPVNGQHIPTGFAPAGVREAA